MENWKSFEVTLCTDGGVKLSHGIGSSLYFHIFPAQRFASFRIFINVYVTAYK